MNVHQGSVSAPLVFILYNHPAGGTPALPLKRKHQELTLRFACQHPNAVANP